MNEKENIGNQKWYIEFKGLIVFSIVLILFSLSVKFVFVPIFVSEMSIDLNDILSILVAFFAIAMSFAFYFQASQTSNSFYDNTYKFTKDVSETLGRMEGAFGEKLTHLDSNYSRIDKKMERVFDPESAKQEILDSRTEADDSEAKKDELIRKLIERANMQEGEKREFFDKIKEAEESLISSRERIAFLENELDSRELTQNRLNLSKTSENTMKRYANSKIIAGMGGEEIIKNSSLIQIKELFAKYYDNISPAFLSDMRNYGYLNGEKLTLSGAHWIRNLAMR